MALEQLLTGGTLVLTSLVSSVTVVLLGHEHIRGCVVTSRYQSHATGGSWTSHPLCRLWLYKSCCDTEWAHAMVFLDISLSITCSVWTVDRSVIMLVVVVHHVEHYGYQAWLLHMSICTSVALFPYIIALFCHCGGGSQACGHALQISTSRLHV